MANNPEELNTFSTVFTQFRKPYTLFAYSYVKNMGEAEDIYMDVMMRLWEKRKDLPDNVHFPSYVLMAIKSRSLNYLRHQKVVAETNENLTDHQFRELNFRISSLEDCNPTELLTDEIQQIIKTTLDNMNEYTRLIFFMSRYENKTNREISNELGINIKTVEYHISKCLKALQKNLKDYLPLFLLGLF